eukprot:TRINITY_DN1191_c1_g1_i1.p1 TRINITY_DN1191_c1_g1~~TRINITY_DN1191_c1_g1_i1.p1  ORF type:complete len:349 (+),score=40.25 TRINITY_DN1191_c1_g1_i1:509-1555(+)
MRSCMSSHSVLPGPTRRSDAILKEMRLAGHKRKSTTQRINKSTANLLEEKPRTNIPKPYSEEATIKRSQSVCSTRANDNEISKRATQKEYSRILPEEVKAILEQPVVEERKEVVAKNKDVRKTGVKGQSQKAKKEKVVEIDMNEQEGEENAKATFENKELVTEQTPPKLTIKEEEVLSNNKKDKYRKFITNPKARSSIQKLCFTESKSGETVRPKKRIDICIEEDEVIVKDRDAFKPQEVSEKPGSKSEEEIEKILRNSLSMKSREEMEEYFHSVQSIRSSSSEKRPRAHRRRHNERISDAIEQYLKQMIKREDTKKEMKLETPNFGCAKNKHNFSFYQLLLYHFFIL